jgi:GntR family transcriptional regulator
MEIRIDSSNEVPIRLQLTEQIIFLIATERIRHGEHLPSVRELARRLKVHHNTVSEAYQDLVRRKWLERRRGSRLTVISREAPESATLDDLINRTIALARENGYSLQQLRDRVRARLLLEAPDHSLVVEQDEGLRELMCEELRSAGKSGVEGCSREDLAANPGLAIGALVVTPQHALRHVRPLVPKERTIVPVRYAPADKYVRIIRELKKPSVVAVVSMSDLFLKTARSILAPVLGSRHDLCEIHLQSEDPKAARSADVIFCDSIASKRIRSPKAFHYPLLASDSIEYAVNALASYRSQL